MKLNQLMRSAIASGELAPLTFVLRDCTRSIEESLLFDFGYQELDETSCWEAGSVEERLCIERYGKAVHAALKGLAYSDTLPTLYRAIESLPKEQS